MLHHLRAELAVEFDLVVAVVKKLIVGGFEPVALRRRELAAGCGGILVQIGETALAVVNAEIVTGVHRDTSKKEIARVTPLYAKYFACCIDLDRSALNTFGNALEIKRWAREHNFNSLIVVTSNWHMPRAMAEVTHQLPDVTLIAYPVLSEKVKSDPWWASADTARVYMSEYLKFLFAHLRMRLDPDSGT